MPAADSETATAHPQARSDRAGYTSPQAGRSRSTRTMPPLRFGYNQFEPPGVREERMARAMHGVGFDRRRTPSNPDVFKHSEYTGRVANPASASTHQQSKDHAKEKKHASVSKELQEPQNDSTSNAATPKLSTATLPSPESNTSSLTGKMPRGAPEASSNVTSEQSPGGAPLPADADAAAGSSSHRQSSQSANPAAASGAQSNASHSGPSQQSAQYMAYPLSQNVEGLNRAAMTGLQPPMGFPQGYPYASFFPNFPGSPAVPRFPVNDSPASTDGRSPAVAASPNVETMSRDASLAPPASQNASSQSSRQRTPLIVPQHLNPQEMPQPSLGSHPQTPQMPLAGMQGALPGFPQGYAQAFIQGLPQSLQQALPQEPSRDTPQNTTSTTAHHDTPLSRNSTPQDHNVPPRRTAESESVTGSPQVSSAQATAPQNAATDSPSHSPHLAHLRPKPAQQTQPALQQWQQQLMQNFIPDFNAVLQFQRTFIIQQLLQTGMTLEQIQLLGSPNMVPGMLPYGMNSGVPAMSQFPQASPQVDPQLAQYLSMQLGQGQLSQGQLGSLLSSHIPGQPPSQQMPSQFVTTKDGMAPGRVPTQQSPLAPVTQASAVQGQYTPQAALDQLRKASTPGMFDGLISIPASLRKDPAESGATNQARTAGSGSQVDHKGSDGTGALKEPKKLDELKNEQLKTELPQNETSGNEATRNGPDHRVTNAKGPHKATSSEEAAASRKSAESSFNSFEVARTLPSMKTDSNGFGKFPVKLGQKSDEKKDFKFTNCNFRNYKNQKPMKFIDVSETPRGRLSMRAKPAEPDVKPDISKASSEPVPESGAGSSAAPPAKPARGRPPKSAADRQSDKPSARTTRRRTAYMAKTADTDDSDEEDVLPSKRYRTQRRTAGPSTSSSAFPKKLTDFPPGAPPPVMPLISASDDEEDKNNASSDSGDSSSSAVSEYEVKPKQRRRRATRKRG